MVDMSKVSHVEEVDPALFQRDRNTDVNAYLAIPGWVLLNSGTHSYQGDHGTSFSIYFAVGWVGDGPPQFPPA